MKSSMSTTLQPDIYLKHKDYFDAKLIRSLEKAIKKISSLEEQLAATKTTNTSLKRTMIQLKSENKKLLFDNGKIRREQNSLIKENDRIIQQIEELLKQVDENNSTIKNLEKELEIYRRKEEKESKANASNTNFPTSAHPFNKVPNSRVKSDKARGGQKGHRAHVSKPNEQVNQLQIIKVKKAPSGAIAHYDSEKKIDYYYTQEIGVLFESKVIETRYIVCEDGIALDKKILDAYKINPVVYSANLKAMTTYLNVEGAIAYERLSTIMKVLSNGSIDIKPSTMVKWEKEFKELSKEYTQEIIDTILTGKILHVDETSMNVNGKNQWISVLGNSKGCLFLMDSKRSSEEIRKILEDYIGVLIHDHFIAYYKILCEHGECNAHLDRYLQAGIDFEKSEACKQMINLLHASKKKKEEIIALGGKKMEEDEIQKIIEEYESIIKAELIRYEKENPTIAKKYEADYIKTLKRMLEYKNEHLKFLTNFDVPYTNNFAENKCRKIKKKKNISTYVYSTENGNVYCSILTVIETARIQKENPYTKILEIYESKYNNAKEVHYA